MWMNWGARRGRWCVETRDALDHSTDGRFVSLFFARSYTRWRRITRCARPSRRLGSTRPSRAFADADALFSFLFVISSQDAPTATQRVQARRFFDALGDLYPCKTCRADFRVDVDAHPPRVESRASLSRWVCERHNEVNVKLGKPTKSCALRDLDERWRKSTSSSSCDE